MILIRLLLQTVVLALGQIWVNKMRSALTTLGIIIAVGSIIITVAAVDGLKGSVLKQFSSIGANRVWVFPRMPREAPGRYTWRKIRMVPREADGMLAACPSLQTLTPVLGFGAEVQFGDRVEKTVQIQGVRPTWHDIENRLVTQGRQLSSIDEDERRQVCYVNDKAITELRMDSNPVGTYILVDKRRFLIVGVVETKAVSPMFGGGEAQTEIFIPFETARTMRIDQGLYIMATTKQPELYEDAKAEIRAYMRRMRELSPGDPDSFGVEAIEQYVEQFKKIGTFFTIVAGALVSISLLVGGIGIMNIMLVSVSERTREIGLRKAVGARPEVILTQFLVEAIVLCITGGVIGLVFSYGVVYGIKFIPNSPLADVNVPFWAVILSLAFCAGTGLIFGMGPAMKASRLDPIEALRHE
jgi:putative ABC transport system permease protein